MRRFRFEVGGNINSASNVFAPSTSAVVAQDYSRGDEISEPKPRVEGTPWLQCGTGHSVARRSTSGLTPSGGLPSYLVDQIGTNVPD
jgi:hypothetical protein